MRLTRQGVSGFKEWYDEQPDSPDGTRRFKIDGKMTRRDGDGLTDAEALEEGYVSVTPLGLDLTARTFAPGAAGSQWDWIVEAGLAPG